jgi:hypothetical protein
MTPTGIWSGCYRRGVRFYEQAQGVYFDDLGTLAAKPWATSVRQLLAPWTEQP